MTFTSDRRERLDKFLASCLPEHSRSKLVKIIEAGQVLVNGVVQDKSRFEVQPAMVVELPEVEDSEPHDLTPADIPLDIRYEDEHLLVVNKPRGLAAHPAMSLKEPSLVNALLGRDHALSQTGGSFRPGIVHRLDKDTTGLMVVAKTDAAHIDLAKQIERKTAGRRYVCVVAGSLDRERFTIDAPIARDKHNRLKMGVEGGGKPAITHIKKLGAIPMGTLLAVRLETGRTHQIRVHLRAVGLPVIGDVIYAPKEYHDSPLQLHATFLSFTHPATGELVSVYAEPPEDFHGRELVTLNVIDPF